MLCDLLYEVMLGRQKFGGETHAYSVAFADQEIDVVVSNADKIIFNSIGQLDHFDDRSMSLSRGLRLSLPNVQYSAPPVTDAIRLAAVVD